MAEAELDAPKLSRERVSVLEADRPRRGHPDVADHVVSFDGHGSQELGDGRINGGRGIDEGSQSLALVEAQPPAVAVDVGSSSSLREAFEREAEVGRRRSIHSEDLAHGEREERSRGTREGDEEGEGRGNERIGGEVCGRIWRGEKERGRFIEGMNVMVGT